MGSEILLLGYGLVCFSMILFSIVQSQMLRHNDAQLSHRSVTLENLLAEQFQYIESNKTPEPHHFRNLGKMLEQLPYLLAFDRMLEQAEITVRNTAFSEYLHQLQPTMVGLAHVYLKREGIQTAYFAHFLTKHRMIMEVSNQEIQKMMLLYLEKPSLYCRVNGFRGLCAFGSQENLLQAIRIIDQQDVFFHGKLLTEILLGYTGNHHELMTTIWKELPKFLVDTQVALLNYIRFKSGECCPQFFQILTGESQQKEQRLAALRYFGRYTYAPAKQVMLQMLTNEDPIHWEYASIAASSLARYEGEDVVAALTKAMSSGQWYVRYNAANALKNMKLEYDDLIAVVHEGDRYAREMVMYRLITREQEQQDRGTSQ